MVFGTLLHDQDTVPLHVAADGCVIPAGSCEAAQFLGVGGEPGTAIHISAAFLCAALNLE